MKNPTLIIFHAFKFSDEMDMTKKFQVWTKGTAGVYQPCAMFDYMDEILPHVERDPTFDFPTKKLEFGELDTDLVNLKIKWHTENPISCWVEWQNLWRVPRAGEWFVVEVWTQQPTNSIL